MKVLLGVLAALLLLAGPGLIFGGFMIMSSNPCFFRQFPPVYCSSANNGPSGAGVVLLILGLVLTGMLIMLMAIGERKK